MGVLGSFTSQDAFTYHPGELIPSDGFTLDNYKKFFNGEQPVWRWMLNSFIVATVSTLVYLLFAGLSAYALVFMKFRFRNVLFTFMLFTMVIPGVATLIPQIANVSRMGISRSLWALILPGLGGVGGLYLIRQFFLGIPKDFPPCGIAGRQIGIFRARIVLLYGKLERSAVAADNSRYKRPQALDAASRYSRAVCK